MKKENVKTAWNKASHKLCLIFSIDIVIHNQIVQFQLFSFIIIKGKR
jgi:hypothetical protein